MTRENNEFFFLFFFLRRDSLVNIGIGKGLLTVTIEKKNNEKLKSVTKTYIGLRTQVRDFLSKLYGLDKHR